MSEDGELDDLVVHPRWQAWVAENLARGAEPASLVEALVAEGVPAVQAEACVRDIADSPALVEARRLRRRVEALEQMVRLRRELRAVAPAIERRLLPAPEELVARHWIPGVPLVITDLVPRWPAFGKWSLDHLAEHFGDVRVDACLGRAGVPDPDPEWSGLERQLALRELVALLAAPHPTNDIYVIAKNAVLRSPGLAGLLEDLVLPRTHFAAVDPMRMGLWIGGAGTHTSLHHDGDNSMFCQVVGRKRVRLAPPESLALLDRARGVYCSWDPRDQAELERGPEALAEVVLEAGDALFIPAGWWHQVDALEVSISVSILALAWPNDFSWYKPGTALAGRAGG